MTDEDRTPFISPACPAQTGCIIYGRFSVERKVCLEHAALCQQARKPLAMDARARCMFLRDRLCPKLAQAETPRSLAPDCSHCVVSRTDGDVEPPQSSVGLPTNPARTLI